MLKSKIAKNLFSLTIGQILTFILNFFAILLAARFLGVENFGTFTALLAIITIISKFIDFGLGPIVFREQSKESNDFSFLNNAISIRLIFTIIALPITNILLISLNYNSTEIILTNALFLNIFFSQRMANFRELLATPFKISLNMQYPMALSVLENLFFLVFVLLLPFFNNELSVFIVIYIVSSLPSFLLLFYYLHKDFNYKFTFNISLYKWMVKESAPIGGFVILMIIFQQIDILILKEINGVFEAGIFAVANRITFPLNIIPTTIITTIFPKIIQNISSNNNQANERIIKIVYKILFVISYLISITYTFKSEELTRLLFGVEYLNSALPTILLLWTQTFLFYNFFSLDLLTAYNLQKWNFVYAVLLIILNIALALFLIPLFASLGAAASKLIVGLFSFIFLLIILNKNKILFNFVDMNLIVWIILTGIVIYFLSKLSLIIYLVLCLIGIISINFYFSFFKTEEIIYILKIIGQEKWAFLFLRKSIK
jgi:O-antigen/teichoic acid export membrane protein